MSYKVVSLFSGAGGMDIGFLKAGFDIIWANDFDKSSVQSYNHNIIDHAIHGDIATISSKEIPECEGVIGGPPCQGFSVAGKMDPNDPRSQLIWEFHRVVKDKKPLFFVMENVKSLAENKRFTDVKDKFLNKMKRLGYKTAVKVLNSKDHDVPQARERAIFIGIKKDLNIDPETCFPEVLDHKITVREALLSMPPVGEKGNDGICKAKIVPAKNPIMRKSPYAGMLFNGQGRPLDLDEPAKTMTASMGGNKTPFVDTHFLHGKTDHCWVKKYHESIVETGKVITEAPKHLRRITVQEAAKLQTFPENYDFQGSQCSQYRQIGNAVPVNLAREIGISIKAELDKAINLNHLSVNSKAASSSLVDYNLQ